MNNFIIKKRNTKSGVVEFGNIIFTDKIKALERANELNESEVNKNLFIHTVVEVIEVEQEKRYECDMEDEELKEYRETILAIEKDLCDNILSYDEWAALEYGDIFNVKLSKYTTNVEFEIDKDTEKNESGKDTYFTLVLTNEDPTSSIGRQQVTLIDCNMDESEIAKLDTEAEFLDESANFTFSDVILNEGFKALS